jgi:arsenate reductase
LCTYNSVRSQMAEGLLRHLGEGRFEVYSAGTEATRVRPEAISVMSELGVDIARAEGEGEERLAVFRWVRDEVKARAEGPARKR